MDSELANYEYQLQQVKTALAADPRNAELQKLVRDLQEVITLTKELGKLGGSNKQSDDDSSAPSGLSSGSACEARYSADGLWYGAKIVSVAGDQYTVTYTQYGNSEVLSSSDIRPLPGATTRVPGDEKVVAAGHSRAKDLRELKKKKMLKKLQKICKLQGRAHKTKEKT